MIGAVDAFAAVYGAACNRLAETAARSRQDLAAAWSDVEVAQAALVAALDEQATREEAQAK